MLASLEGNKQHSVVQPGTYHLAAGAVAKYGSSSPNAYIIVNAIFQQFLLGSGTAFQASSHSSPESRRTEHVALRLEAQK